MQIDSLDPAVSSLPRPIPNPLLPRNLQSSVCPSCGSKSLLDVGYSFANLDDGWQACGQGENGGFHDADGNPMMDLAKFPNVSSMTSLARALGLRPGFYVNNYICGGGECQGGVGGAVYEKVMHGTVGWLKRNRFEYLKVDSGGCYNDMQLWHDLLEAEQHPMTVENCHQGGEPPKCHVVPVRPVAGRRRRQWPRPGQRDPPGHRRV